MRWQRLVAVSTAVTVSCALLAASPAAAADEPVAACPPGKVSLTVARAAQGTFAIGPFSVVVDGAGVRVQSAGRVLWSSVSHIPFVSAGKGTVQFTDGGGFYQVQAEFSRRWRRQGIVRAVLSRRALRLTGTLGAGARFAVTFSRASSVRLAMTVHVSAPGETTVLLTAASPRGEAVHGFGAMTRWNLKGGIVPILSRSRESVAGNPWSPRSRTSSRLRRAVRTTTYAVVPEYLTSSNRGFFWSDDEYGVFDLTRRDRIASQLWARTVHAQVLLGRTPAELIRAYTQYVGRMKPLPHWVDRGAIVGIQGGTDTVLARVAALRAAGVPLAGVWLQDWVG